MKLNRITVFGSLVMVTTCGVVFGSHVMVTACGPDEPVERPRLVIETPRANGALFEAQGRAPADQITPMGALTEEAVIRLTAEAMSNRDLEGLRDLAAPEQSADLWRLHNEDAGRFWNRARLWVQDVKSGVTIAQRDEDSEDVWRVLVRFGNGNEETMTFTRVRGALKVMRF
jgi:hypothetical protein